MFEVPSVWCIVLKFTYLIAVKGFAGVTWNCKQLKLKAISI